MMLAIFGLTAISWLAILVLIIIVWLILGHIR